MLRAPRLEPQPAPALPSGSAAFPGDNLSMFVLSLLVEYRIDSQGSNDRLAANQVFSVDFTPAAETRIF